MTEKLTRKKAISISIELWEWMAKYGSKDKSRWPGWETYGKMDMACALCEYVGYDACLPKCPLGPKFGGCESTAYEDWADADTKYDRKTHAKAFLKQLKAI